MGLGFSRQGNVDQSTMYLINEISSLKRSFGALDSSDGGLGNLAAKLSEAIDNFKSMAANELSNIKDSTAATQRNIEDSLGKAMDMIEGRTKYFKDVEVKLEGVRGKFEDSIQSGDRVFKFIKEEYESLSQNITNLNKELTKASGNLDSTLNLNKQENEKLMNQFNQNFTAIEGRFDSVAERVGERTAEIFSSGVFREQFTQTMLNDVQQVLGETLPLILEEEVGRSLERLSKAPEVVEAAEKVDIAALELKDLSTNLYNYLQTLTQEVKSLTTFANQAGATDLKTELAGFLNSMQDQLDTIKNYESTITQVLRTELPKLAAGGASGGATDAISQVVGQKIEETTLELKNTAVKMHDVFAKFNEQMGRMVAFLEALKTKEDELKQREARILEYERRMR